MTRWLLTGGMAALLALTGKPGLPQEMESDPNQDVIVENANDADSNEITVESSDLDDDEADTTSRDPVFRIQVLRHPYEISRFYRSDGGIQPFAYRERDFCEPESVLMNPYLISSFYRSDASPRFLPWFVAEPTRRSPAARHRARGARPGSSDSYLSDYECVAPRDR